MELILMQDVPNLGGIGELVNVKPGYGRNFLLPRKLAVVASTKSKARLEHEKRVAAFKFQKAKAASLETAKKMSGTEVVITRKVGENDKMFGSVTSQDIVHALAEKGIVVERKKVVLHDPIKQLGEVKVTVKLRTDVTTEILVKVVGEAAAS